MEASERIDNYIAKITDWRGPVVARLRELILEADPGITEEWKWNSPVWARHGLVVSVGAFKNHVKVNVFKGASLADPNGLLNDGLEAKYSRGIRLEEGDSLDPIAFKDLIRAAVAHNVASS